MAIDYSIEAAHQAYEEAVAHHQEIAARLAEAGRIRRVAYRVMLWSAEGEVTRTGEELVAVDYDYRRTTAEHAAVLMID